MRIIHSERIRFESLNVIAGDPYIYHSASEGFMVRSLTMKCLTFQCKGVYYTTVLLWSQMVRVMHGFLYKYLELFLWKRLGYVKMFCDIMMFIPTVNDMWISYTQCCCFACCLLIFSTPKLKSKYNSVLINPKTQYKLCQPLWIG